MNKWIYRGGHDINTKNNSSNQQSSLNKVRSSFDMRAITTFTVLVLALCACGAFAFAPRIVGGNDAPVGKYPYLVSLRFRNKIFCGASILSKRWILTAAHCIDSIPAVVKREAYISAGTNFLNETGTVYKIGRMIPHEDFVLKKVKNDIGLVRVTEDIVFNDKVQPIQLSTEDYPVGHPAVLAGWGRLKVGGKSPNNLQEIDLQIADQQLCKSKHRVEVTETNICTFTKAGQGACHGDSGGPLVANGKQIGVVSFGKPCAVGAPDVFTRVTKYLSWLKENMY